MPRKKKTVTAPEAAPETPKCAACGSELTWRDRFYVPTPKKPEDADEQWTPPPPTCKRCYQKATRTHRITRGAFHPLTRQITRSKSVKPVVTLVTDNRAMRRAWAHRSLAQPVLPRERPATRAERRANARKVAAARHVAEAA